MKKIAVIFALALVIAVVIGCAPRAVPGGTQPTAAAQGETEISQDVSEVAGLESELADAEAESELDSIGDMFSDW